LAETIVLRDGRALTYGEMGDPSGTPALLFHGTPGSRHQVMVDDAPMVAAGVRCIAPDRPGYGGSTYAKHRRLVDWADDVAELADHLGLDRFAVLGVSGGGPHAAVCAARLGDRVTSLGLLSSVGPLDERGSEAGMMPVNRMFARLARKVPAVNALPFGLMAAMGRRAPDRLVAQLKKSAPKADAAVLDRPEVAESVRLDLATASKTAGRAAAQDFALMARDWGFRLKDIAVPTDVWQGGADVNVPPAHARRLAAAIPDAELHLFEGEGHLLCLDHMDDILRNALERAT
jgi:pimeloyl-ACP methyl ester carboxylesterase